MSELHLNTQTYKDIISKWLNINKREEPLTDNEKIDLAISILGGANPDEDAAIDAINQFTRVRRREDSLFRRIIPPLEITNDELDKQC